MDWGVSSSEFGAFPGLENITELDRMEKGYQ